MTRNPAACSCIFAQASLKRRVKKHAHSEPSVVLSHTCLIWDQSMRDICCLYSPYLSLSPLHSVFLPDSSSSSSTHDKCAANDMTMHLRPAEVGIAKAASMGRSGRTLIWGSALASMHDPQVGFQRLSFPVVLIERTKAVANSFCRYFDACRWGPAVRNDGLSLPPLWRDIATTLNRPF